MIKIVAIMPCYKNSEIAPSVARDVIRFVDKLICVDDYCPESTGENIRNSLKSEKIDFIFHESNKGIGGAMKSGFIYALKFSPEIVIKIDSDGQMDPILIPKLIEPLLEGTSELTKGNRFTNPKSIRKMPIIRIIGNIGLGFITKLSTGYWELFDPTNGYLAIRRNILEKINIDKIDDKFFFETDLLFRFGLADAMIVEMPTKVIYNNEISNLVPLKQVTYFIKKLFVCFIKRIFYQYFLFEINIGSFELFLTIIISSCAIGWNIYSVVSGILLNKLSSPGTTAIGVILTISALQFMLAFINYDVTQRLIIKRLRYRKNNN